MEPVVCSIQSWVCHGYVGNKCSVFALQQLGIEVDPINSVHFSNHTGKLHEIDNTIGYKSWKGQVLSGDQIVDLFDGLVANKLANYSHLLTGYVNSVATLRSIMKILTEMKQLNKNLIYGILKNERVLISSLRSWFVLIIHRITKKSWGMKENSMLQKNL